MGVNPQSTPEPEVYEEVRNETQESKPEQISIRINRPDYEFLMAIKGKMMQEEKKTITFADLIQEMCTKWDSLIVCSEQLKSLSEVEK